MNFTVAKILELMLHDSMRTWYSLRLADETGITSGSIYPALARLEKKGVLDSDWETPITQQEGKARRRVYWLRDTSKARKLLEELQVSLST